MKNQNVSGIFDQMRERRLNEETEVEEYEVEVKEVSEEELDEAVKTVVRDGKVEKKNVPTHKKRLTAAQKKALAQARKKAHTASANKARAKSMKKRNSMNMEDNIVCPECGFEGSEDDYDEEDGVLYCPECGAEVEGNADEACKKKNEACKKNEEVDIVELAVRLDECNGSKYMKRALNEGKFDLVQRYLDIKEGE